MIKNSFVNFMIIKFDNESRLKKYLSMIITVSGLKLAPLKSLKQI